MEVFSSFLYFLGEIWCRMEKVRGYISPDKHLFAYSTKADAVNLMGSARFFCFFPLGFFPPLNHIVASNLE